MSSMRQRWRVVKQGAHVREMPGGREVARLDKNEVIEQVDTRNYNNRVWIAFYIPARKLIRQQSINIFRPASTSVSKRPKDSKMLVWTVVTDRKSSTPKLELIENSTANSSNDESSSNSRSRNRGKQTLMRRNATVRTLALVQALEGGQITAQEYEIIQQIKLRAIAEDNPRLDPGTHGAHGRNSPACLTGPLGKTSSSFSAGAAYLTELRTTGIVPAHQVLAARVCPMSFAFALGVMNFHQGLTFLGQSHHYVPEEKWPDGSPRRTQDQEREDIGSVVTAAAATTTATTTAAATAATTSHCTNISQATPGNSGRSLQQPADPYLHGQQTAIQHRTELVAISFNRGLEASKRAVSAK